MPDIEKIIEREAEKGDERSIIYLVDELIAYAQGMRASDIHIDPSERNVRIRLRIDGVLQKSLSVPRHFHDEIISRIKVLAGLRTDEHQAAQDGRFRAHLPDKSAVDIRVSIAPTYHGENAVLRLLADKEEQFTLGMLGFSDDDRAKIQEAIERPTGMILATGPTGSGKTTTLYTIIKMLNTEGVSIVTIEDPIEYAVDGIEQIQVNARASLTFANGLRSILRQDPNIIMVGEIRDKETAGIAVNTALTGHLLLSTLHTNDAATTLPRLLDMGIEPYLVASTVNIAIGQRLVRRICPDCKAERAMTDAERDRLLELLPHLVVESDRVLHEGKGCNECGGTGYRGRLCVNEVMMMDGEVREAVLRKASASEIRKIAIRNGMTPMLADGLYKAQQGLTTVEEVLRVVHE
ncbi:GspE/PulE family protein [Candidatus Wolfebacteria bacterium]|nr:GspE/PulE family protein [Candidatus Wolfebacteria bacterium]